MIKQERIAQPQKRTIQLQQALNDITLKRIMDKVRDRLEFSQILQTPVPELAHDFYSTISHELRTPISKIQITVQKLEDIKNHKGSVREKHSAIAEYLPILQAECDQEIKLIKDLLTLQKLTRRAKINGLTTGE